MMCKPSSQSVAISTRQRNTLGMDLPIVVSINYEQRRRTQLEKVAYNRRTT